MAARSGQKIKIVCILDILRRYSDEENPINAAFICEKLGSMGVTAERKSVYQDISTLIDYGYDIIRATTPKKGFFLASREFELPEIYLLSDAVKSADFITPKKTRELLSKLDGMLSRNQATKLEKGIYMNFGNKCSNEEIYYNIDSLNRAIQAGKKVSLIYSVRTLDNRSIKTISKERIISPYALTWQDDHYYLIGNYEKYDNLIHLRIDRMKNVCILEEKSRDFRQVSEYTEQFDVADYTNKLFSMYGGELCEVEFTCDKSILEQVADRFSENIFIKNVSENRFGFSVKAALSDALVTWIINYGDKIEVKAPELLRKMVKDRAEKVLGIYK